MYIKLLSIRLIKYIKVVAVIKGVIVVILQANPEDVL